MRSSLSMNQSSEMQQQWYLHPCITLLIIVFTHRINVINCACMAILSHVIKDLMVFPIAVNALKLNLEGFIQLDGDNINMDLKYAAPQNNFKNFLSYILFFRQFIRILWFTLS